MYTTHTNFCIQFFCRTDHIPLIIFILILHHHYFFFFFFNDTPPPEFSPLPLHAPLPICPARRARTTRKGTSGRCTTTTCTPPPPMARGRSASPRIPSTTPKGRCPPTAGPSSSPRCATAISDRKSTRLNSSHSQISYAVFC